MFDVINAWTIDSLIVGVRYCFIWCMRLNWNRDLLQMLLIWLLKVLFWSKNTPKFFTFEVGRILLLPNLKLIFSKSILANCCLFPIIINSVLLSLIFNWCVSKNVLTSWMHFSKILSLIEIDLLEGSQAIYNWAKSV